MFILDEEGNVGRKNLKIFSMYKWSIHKIYKMTSFLKLGDIEE